MYGDSYVGSIIYSYLDITPGESISRGMFNDYEYDNPTVDKCINLEEKQYLRYASQSNNHGGNLMIETKVPLPISGGVAVYLA